MNTGTPARSVAWNVASQSAARVVTLALSLGTTMLLTRHFGVDAYGALVTVLAYVSFVSFFFDWGTQTSLVRALAGGGVSPRELLGKALVLRLLLSGLAAGAGAALLPVLYPGRPDVRMAGFVLLASLPPNAAASTLESVFQARLRNGRLALAQVASQIAATGAVAGLVASGAPLPVVVGAFVAGAAVYCALVVVLARRLVRPALRLDVRFCRRFLAVSLPLGTALLLNTLYFRIDALLLTALRGPGQAGLYGVAYRFLEALLPFVGFFVASLFPLLASAAGSADLGSVRTLCQRGLDVLAVVAAAVSPGTIVLAPRLVRLVAGGGFGGAVGPLRVLVLCCALMFVNGLLGYVVIALRKQKRALWLNVVVLVLNVALNLVLIPRFGALGAASAATASELAVLVGNLWLLRRYADFTPSLGVAVRAFAGGFTMAAVVAAAGLDLGASVALGAGVYACVLFALGVHLRLDLAAVLRPARRLDDAAVA